MWKNPDIDPSAFIAPSADIYGDVSIAENCSIWFHATVRAGAGSVSIGAGTNVQDLIIASHDLDCPWRPRDVGRILRTFKIKKNVEVTDNGKIII